ncbi:ABC transporter G family member 2 [Gracilariopsis chorda]|uniref:Probable ATP-dependent transporter ycf16 n=1 Tax=Gracilariopsis chorda TaxID=448386 RepID=A0A2V3IWD4_9FLOR|nr:ABC transporter G family member 2 [Gracilariopsis chorda]|eukprot:PXF46399.1 ABC transporter G family member 2 [Gracilariopsis chorda]
MPPHFHPALSATVWDNKKRVESLYNDFPDINVSAPDFDIKKYVGLLREILHAADVPLHPIATTWESLRCTVPISTSGAIDTVVSCFTGLASAVSHGCARIMTPHTSGKPPSASVLHDVSGYLLPGQLCLVLGSSGSGTSLLLSRIAGREMPKIIQTSGDVSYQTVFNPGQAKPAHFTRYIGQHDVHIPQLTVRQTLEFAAECIWPAWIPHVDAIRRNEVILTARGLGIERTLDTIVGSDILRGVSGGERKRVTIAEMQIGGVAGTLIMDNWSKGLDSGTTLSITQAVRSFADVLKGSALLSMQAPGSEVYSLFDTLCLLDQGQLLYFGPTGDAEGYFNSLGLYRPQHRSLPDFLSTIADPLIQTEYLDGPNSLLQEQTTARLDTDNLATKFRESEHFAKLQDTIASVKAQPRDDTLRPKEHIEKIGAKRVLQSPRYQIAALARRQWRHIMSIRRSFLAEVLQNLVLGLLLGSIFWQLPDTAGGANSRGGILFLILLLIGLSSLAKIPVRFEEKEVFAKQKAASFFDAWPYLLTQAIFDFCQELIKTAALVIPVYLMAGLNLGGSAQRLLYCLLIIVMVSLTMISMTRFVVAIFDDAESASGFAGVLTIVLVLLNGYLKTPTEIQGYLIWIYWIDPLHYAFEALLINEYDGLNFKCTLEERIPANSNIPAEFRVCPVSTGEQYLEDTFGITNDKIFRLYFFLVLLGFQVLFFLLSAYTTARTKPKGHPQREISQSSASSVRPNDKDAVAIDVQNSPSQGPHKNRFTFTDMSYSVDDGRKVLLNKVTGNAVGGKVVLLMGESGAGKTTLLDVCAMRKTLGKGTSVSGEVRLNGRVLDKKALAHLSGYCEQSDLHVEEATVREALLFSAKLRLPKSITLKEKMDKVENVLAMLRLEPYQHVLVKALGAGEKKLLTMGVEVVTEPKVLFLDEPTSGISSSSAMTVARALRRIAETGTCVVCTVHQPSAEVFDMFDMLLLLKRGGKVVYFGDIGEHGATLRSYFEARGAEQMNEDANAAAWMLDVISDEKTDWAEEWLQSKEKEEQGKQTAELAEGDEDSSNGWGEDFDTPSFPRQTVEMIRRQFWRYWRLPEYNTTRVMLLLMIALMIGLLFLRELSNTQTGAMLSFAALFLTVIPSNLSAQNVIPPTTSGRAVFYREIASGTYETTAHHVAVGLVELPFTVVATTVFVVVFYFMVGLTPGRFGYFFLASQLLYLFTVVLGVMLASVTPTAAFAENLANSILSLFNVVSGFFIRKDEMPSWWRWSVWVNPFSYYLSGLVQNEMENKTFICEAGEFGLFRIPDGVSDCASIAGGVYENVVENGVITACRFCPVPTGQTLIDLYAADEVNKWLSLVAVVVAIVICRLVTGFGFAKLRFMTR